MPLYNLACRTPLSATQRQSVATLITQAHCHVTTALPHYVNVVFSDNWALPAGIEVSILGGVRIGGTRTHAVVEELKRALVTATAQGCGLTPDAVAISTVGMPAQWIIEGGEVMPEPGAEPGANHPQAQHQAQ